MDKITSCKGCFYNLGAECQTMKNKEIGGCFAYATKEEGIKREKEIVKYSQRFNEFILPKKSTREKLDETFLKLYKEGLNDTKISDFLKVSRTSVNDYRKDMELPPHRNKKKPTAMGK